MSTVNARLQIWSDTAANFTSANPTLASGQWAMETDTGKVKLGDGSTVWTGLGYYSQTYATDVWIPSITGFSSAPTVTVANYTRIGNVCFVHCNFTGTSNDTTMTITLPFTANNSVIQAVACSVTDNGSSQAAAGVLKTRPDSNVADIYRTFANGTFTNTSTKGALLCFTYKIEE